MKENGLHKYWKVAETIEGFIEEGILCVGDKLPSVRAVSKEHAMSVAIAYQAYCYLEGKGLIESKPQSCS